MAARRPWLAFAALSLLYFLVSAGTFNALGVVLPAMVGELHWSWKEAGLGYALLGVACGLTSLAAAGSIRRYGVRLTLLAGGAMLAGGFAAMALTHSVWVYLAAASVIGVAFSFCTSVPGTYVLTAIFERRSTIVGAYFTLGALGGVAGPKLVTTLSALTGCAVSGGRLSPRRSPFQALPPWPRPIASSMRRESIFRQTRWVQGA